MKHYKGQDFIEKVYKCPPGFRFHNSDESHHEDKPIAYAQHELIRSIRDHPSKQLSLNEMVRKHQELYHREDEES